MTADALRKKFLEFFASKGHRIVESDSLVPREDPTVLFTPAGMNQFKKQFLGLITDYTRAASSQRCLRTDDLDKVGKTRGHHTFFEMLGNFSFGDYFKAEAIAWAWEFLTQELKVPPEQLWVSVYKDDDEAYAIWRDAVRVPAARIIRLGDTHNFWPSEAKEKGPNGPCGPCSEIFFDRGKEVGCGKADCNPGCDCGRFFEVWNLVFTQFNRREGGALEPLPQKNIDTGMGLERLAAVMQGVPNNFETDLFRPLLKEIEGGSKKEAPQSKEYTYAVADHLRAVVFAIYDGVLPSNEGRGYVIRKLIRKSSLSLRSLGFKKPFLYKLVPILADIMKDPYPELVGRRENIAEVILSEEKGFLATLDSSAALFEEKFRGFTGASASRQVGLVAFQLYDTYGIPFELTKDWLAARGIAVSEDAFDRELDEQKQRSKSQSNMKGDVFDIKDLDLGVKETQFTGYDAYVQEARILKILKDPGEAQLIQKGEEARVVLDRSCFYAESGGQVGDTGRLINGPNVFEVLDTRKSDKVIVHIGRVAQGAFKKSDTVSAEIDVERRLAVARNHTATHLLQAALRKVLGDHVQQQGSLVAQDRLRFDFTHFKDVSQPELDRIEELVNKEVIRDQGLCVTELALAEARKSGALAFFGEKYDDKVRIVSVGDVSKEFCGGTHLSHTGQIGLFKITQEGSVASGVRRIEAVTADAAYRLVKEEEQSLADIAALLGVPIENAYGELEKRLARIRAIEKQLDALKGEALKNSIDSVIKEGQDINGLQLITKDYKDAQMDVLRKAADLVKAKTSNAIFVGTSGNDRQACVVIAVTQDLCAKGIDASKLIKEVASEIGGSGGGRKDFAQAGGSKPENLNKALEKLTRAISQVSL
ncbi:MAG TPA: alanine--tRNA ligase [Patescibacteria group bacterium]|nr:alanine--tRNA ligase [Patescibacteria group bacterium]